METEIFTLSDYAEDSNGKLIIVGTFDSIYSVNSSSKHPLCALSLRLRFAKSETGRHTIEIRFIDPNGNELQKIDGEIDVKDPVSGVEYTAVNTVIKFANLQLNSFGKYSFELYVDGEWNRGLPLNYVKVANQLKAA